jgi:UDP-N-acetylmuramyl pentapeptide phosphotransferase/UDP-N-acetylglucosamine-1-phosphate transferase
VAILVSVLAMMGLSCDSMLALLTFLALLGLVDDYKPLAAWVRFTGQLIFCGLAILLLHYSFPFFYMQPLNIMMGFFLMLAFINAANFSDGLNGLWPGTFLLWTAYIGYFFGLNVVLLLMIAATLGFFVLNFPSGKIFLGDSGSTFLGGFALLYGLNLAHRVPSEGGDFLMTLTIIFAPFIFLFSDIVMTLVIRIYNGHSPLIPHKTHYNQRLVHEIGLSHATVTLMYFFGGVMTSFFMGFLMKKGFGYLGLVCCSGIQMSFFWSIHRWCDRLSVLRQRI